MAKFKVEDLIIRLSDKIDKNHEASDKRLNNIEIIMSNQQANLELHMKRSDTLEALYNNIKEKELEPLQLHKARVEGGLKLLGIISLLLSIVGGLLKIFGII